MSADTTKLLSFPQRGIQLATNALAGFGYPVQKLYVEKATRMFWFNRWFRDMAPSGTYVVRIPTALFNGADRDTRQYIGLAISAMARRMRCEARTHVEDGEVAVAFRPASSVWQGGPRKASECLLPVQELDYNKLREWKPQASYTFRLEDADKSALMDAVGLSRFK